MEQFFQYYTYVVKGFITESSLLPRENSPNRLGKFSRPLGKSPDRPGKFSRMPAKIRKPEKIVCHHQSTIFLEAGAGRTLDIVAICSFTPGFCGRCSLNIRTRARTHILITRRKTTHAADSSCHNPIFFLDSCYYGGNHIKQDLRYTQKPTYFSIFTHNIRSYLQWFPVVCALPGMTSCRKVGAWSRSSRDKNNRREMRLFTARSRRVRITSSTVTSFPFEVENENQEPENEIIK